MKTRAPRFIFLSALSFCSPAWTGTPGSADFDSSGWVDMGDLFFLSEGWDQVAAPGNPPPGDIDKNGFCGVEDLLILLHKWHTTGPSFEEIEIPLPHLPAGARQLRLARIPAGSFIMGSSDTERGRYYDHEGPVHQVTIGYDYYMGETEITQAQWYAVMRNTPSSDYGVGNDFPVYNVSWNNITQPNGFLERLNALGQGIFRLPSEAEWEYACRAGTTTRFFFGDSLSCVDVCQNCVAGTMPGNRSDFMWYCGNNSPRGNKPVGGKIRNGFGLYDMHGGVWEWCEDYWHTNYAGAPVDGNPWLDFVGSSGQRVLRGGSVSDSAKYCRSAMRGSFNPVGGSGAFGVRVVRLLQ